MKKILIVDAIKPSLVMSSEVFKDKIPGSTIHVASTGKEALELVQSVKPDMCVVDFDLPDVDGPALVLALRNVYKGPILLTAYPDNNVEQAIVSDLYAFSDASSWIKKPVKFDDLSEKIEKYLIEGKRVLRRFQTDLPTTLIVKAAGRGKRAPKLAGKVKDLGLGGARIVIQGPMKIKKQQEITMALCLPAESLKGAKDSAKKEKPTPKSKAKKGAKAKQTIKYVETKIKSRIAWHNKDGQMGLHFGKLTDVQLKSLETFLRREASASPV